MCKIVIQDGLCLRCLTICRSDILQGFWGCVLFLVASLACAIPVLVFAVNSSTGTETERLDHITAAAACLVWVFSATLIIACAWAMGFFIVKLKEEEDKEYDLKYGMNIELADITDQKPMPSAAVAIPVSP